ncbi:glycoside hydrolase family 3 C-terminal domain-containing protein [Paenibacillus terreus]|uniref:Glycoside hydrolase family 3 C-terminal domain-containing protein n=1 Tax=Paenibacillus terreus TaxID=1387834 RepID=A0ABV5BHP5_9BACL
MRVKPLVIRLTVVAVMIAMVMAPFNTSSAEGAAVDKPWMNASLSAKERTALLLKSMTLEEKVDFVTGDVNNNYGFYNEGIERLGIPALKMADGPAGIRVANPDVQDKQATALPAPIALAASWDTEAASQYGDLLGKEAYNTTHNVFLGPGLDIARLPWGSRNFESLGEDPLLQSKLGAAYVKGVQSNPVIATAKHYLLNNQETERFTTNVKADERTIQEVYLRPFESAVQAGLGAAMCSFNKINGVAACDNDEMLNDVLKGQKGFDGFIMSDYGANVSTATSANAGLDLETPGVPYNMWGDKLLAAVKKGEVSEERLDDMVSRILQQMFEKGLFDHPAKNNLIDAKADGALARKIAEDSMVLLQNNNNMLPLSADKLKSIAVIGPDADNGSAAGGGSSKVNPTYSVSPLKGIRERAGNDVDVKYAPGSDPITAGDIIPGPSAVPSSLLHPAVPEEKGASVGYATYDEGENGLRGEYWDNAAMEGSPGFVHTDKQVNMNLGFYNFDFNARSPKVDPVPTKFNSMMSARWTGVIAAPETGEYKLSISSMGSGKLYLDGELFIDNKGTKLETTEKSITLKKGEQHSVRIEYRTDSPNFDDSDYGGMIRFGWEPPADVQDKLIKDAVELARKSDVAVIVTRTYDSEGYVDRSDLELPNNQDRLIKAVAAVNPKTIVVQMSGRAVEMDGWQHDVPAIIQAWYAGQEQGSALAHILFGDVNPSGKLPVTFPVNEKATPVSSEAQFPGINGNGDYSEGIDVGYRGYEKEGIKPAFAFGYGLSYTTFNYSNLKTKADKSGKKESTVEVSLNLRNTGKVSGSEVVQVYTGKLPAPVDTPPKQLAGFAKIKLEPGKQQRVTIQLDNKALSYWDEKSDQWVMPSGEVPIYVGSSSADIRLEGKVTIPEAKNAGKGNQDKNSKQAK